MGACVSTPIKPKNVLPNSTPDLRNSSPINRAASLSPSRPSQHTIPPLPTPSPIIAIPTPTPPIKQSPTYNGALPEESMINFNNYIPHNQPVIQQSIVHYHSAQTRPVSPVPNLNNRLMNQQNVQAEKKIPFLPSQLPNIPKDVTQQTTEQFFKNQRNIISGHGLVPYPTVQRPISPSPILNQRPISPTPINIQRPVSPMNYQKVPFLPIQNLNERPFQRAGRFQIPNPQVVRNQNVPYFGKNEPMRYANNNTSVDRTLLQMNSNTMNAYTPLPKINTFSYGQNVPMVANNFQRGRVF